MSERDPLEYAINRMEAARDVPPPTVDYPARRKELLDGIAALRASEAALAARVEKLEGALRDAWKKADSDVFDAYGNRRTGTACDAVCEIARSALDAPGGEKK